MRLNKQYLSLISFLSEIFMPIVDFSSIKMYAEIDPKKYLPKALSENNEEKINQQF